MSKDAWYTGPDRIKRHKTFWRLPHKFYNNQTGPTTENCSFLYETILDRLTTDGENMSMPNFGEIMFAFPWYQPEGEEYPEIVKAKVQLKLTEFAVQFAFDIFLDQNILDADMDDVLQLLALPHQDENGAIPLGDGSDEQPIVFIEEELYKKYFPLPLNALIFGQLDPLQVKYISRPAQFAAENGNEFLIEQGSSKQGTAHFVSTHQWLGPFFGAEIKPNVDTWHEVFGKFSEMRIIPGFGDETVTFNHRRLDVDKLSRALIDAGIIDERVSDDAGSTAIAKSATASGLLLSGSKDMSHAEWISCAHEIYDQLHPPQVLVFGPPRKLIKQYAKMHPEITWADERWTVNMDSLGHDDYEDGRVQRAITQEPAMDVYRHYYIDRVLSFGEDGVEDDKSSWYYNDRVLSFNKDGEDDEVSWHETIIV